MGLYGDASFLFKVIESSTCADISLAESAPVYSRSLSASGGLPVVNVRDYGKITYVLDIYYLPGAPLRQAHKDEAAAPTIPAFVPERRRYYLHGIGKLFEGPFVRPLL